MASIAFVIASATYTRLPALDCCRTDAEAIAALLSATRRFDDIHRFNDLSADELKSNLRDILNPLPASSEIFFYFSGHGHSENGEFFFCPKDFDPRRPNETGLPNADLHALLRESSPELVVKVIDACSSGSLLIKSDTSFLPSDKGGLKNLVQIASCLDSQTSLAGDPLSEFTEQFCLAATRKSQGAVYYTDIANIIRDQYINNDERIPHFVFQFSARETFTEDASALDEFRIRLSNEWSSAPPTEPILSDTRISGAAPIAEPSLLELLKSAEEKLAHPDEVNSTISAIFDGLKARIEIEKFSEYYEIAFTENSKFDDNDSYGFIVRVLSQQKRSDNFVTANITRKRKRRNPFEGIYSSLYSLGIYNDDDFTEHWDLNLNMSLQRAQLSVTLTPRFMALQRIKLVVTCAPSLERCYVFELSTRHPRTDFNAFESDGTDVTRRWYSQDWSGKSDWLIEKIAGKLSADIEDQLNLTKARLSDS